MGIFRRPRYDRKAVLEAAATEAARGRRRRAIDHYRRVLAAEPRNVELHRRLAPLLAAAGQPFDAWLSYRTAAAAHQRAKELVAARDLFREAARALPGRIDAWLAWARTERRLGRSDAAVEALLEGRAAMGRRRRPEAIHLLREALEIRPWDPDLVIDLARLLARTRQRDESEMLLEQLAERSEGSARRRVRGAQWRLGPMRVGHAWRWLRAA